ncbi:hypothetical protein CVT24_010086 [Panaeolus cyanescens]|uniref:Nudix hydrolase domain-containing protein n=1 Tax=Panaeolus cyanescens TaxID=181874 RepID=A0A409YQ32_9AGAR|nr:hypothetical protein CVT24_010086 [Panaeolus cyanescens]
MSARQESQHNETDTDAVHWSKQLQSPVLPRLSQFASGAVDATAWSSLDFLLGAGTVIIQPTTHKIVVVYHKTQKYWFFPRGRKDVGESLEVAALREAYEETGYRATFLPLVNPTRQPPAPSEGRTLLNTEAVYMTFKPFHPRRLSNGQREAQGGQYLTFWYVAQIPENAIHEKGTGMPDEQDFESHLLTYEQAMKNVWGEEVLVLRYAWEVYQHTLKTVAFTSLDGSSIATCTN